MTQVVQGHDGSVNKFIGDGLLAIWGAPTPCQDHAVRATRAALDMQKVMAEINEAREAKGEPALRVGIVLHTGHVAAGMLGSSTQAEYGDRRRGEPAWRIEGLTKIAARRAVARLVGALAELRGERTENYGKGARPRGSTLILALSPPETLRGC
jgi:class 3 adenylate cyclase